MPKIKLEPGQARVLVVRYTDLVLGHRGLQVRFKGWVENEDVVLYLDAEPCLTQLLQCGALEHRPATPDARELASGRAFGFRLREKRLLIALAADRGYAHLSITCGPLIGPAAGAPGGASPAAEAGAAGSGSGGRVHSPSPQIHAPRRVAEHP